MMICAPVSCTTSSLWTRSLVGGRDGLSGGSPFARAKGLAKEEGQKATSRKHDGPLARRYYGPVSANRSVRPGVRDHRGLRCSRRYRHHHFQAIRVNPDLLPHKQKSRLSRDPRERDGTTLVSNTNEVRLTRCCIGLTRPGLLFLLPGSSGASSRRCGCRLALSRLAGCR